MMNFLYNFLPQNQHLDAVMSPQTPDVRFSKLIENIICKTRNIILYGSPGTGKTYTVSQFAKLFLSKQLQSPITPEQRRQDSVKDLTWHEAIAFAMYVNYQKGKLFKVTELVKDDLIDACS